MMKMKHSGLLRSHTTKVLLLLFLAFSFDHPTNSSSTSATDLEALLAFRTQVDVDPHGVLRTNWTSNSSSSFCSWLGISCDQRHRQRVTAISLHELHLGGTISPYLGNLSFLSYLNISNCSLHGPIPPSLGRLPRLRVLDLQDNFLSGPIPPALFNASSLVEIYLPYNKLTGPLPANSTVNLPRLEVLSLSLNRLTGEIPSYITERCKLLRILYLWTNEFTGVVPSTLGSLPNLMGLQLGRNRLTGRIPPSLGNLTKLASLGISFNEMEGEIPEELWNLLHLRQISLSGNKLTGGISSRLARCRALQYLNLDSNFLGGPIPSELGSLQELTKLYLGSNSLVGTIPTSLANLTKLMDLGLDHNELEGEIPRELGNLRNMEWLNLGPNRLTGSFPIFLLNASKLILLQLSGSNLMGPVPVTIGTSLPLLYSLTIDYNKFTGGLEFITSLSACRGLEFIEISENIFDGVLPDSIGNLSGLQHLYASGSKIRGPIPPSLGNLSSLIQLDLSYNDLDGELPIEISKLSRLQMFFMKNNRVTGFLPIEFGLMKSLGNLHLENNKFTGVIPDSIGNISQLQRLSLSTNKLSSRIPLSLWRLKDLIELNLSRNALQGSLPVDIAILKMLDVMDVSANRLFGKVPDGIAQLQMLSVLDLSSNSFQGEIPSSLGQLINLMYLNFSCNLLSGSISKSIANLPRLNNLDLSYNHLEGQIPEGRVFSNLTIMALAGNSALCGAPKLGFPPCATSHSTRELHSLTYILPAVVVAAILIACLILMLASFRRRTVFTKTDHEENFDDHMVVPRRDLVRATENFSQGNLIGRGSFGSVYKGCLDDGTIIAVKVLNLEIEGASKSFEAECRAFSMIRHRNLIKIISVCSTPDFKAIILQFMPNGNLDQWLHSDDTCHLSLPERLNIMVDVSLALEYLHHDHPYIVLHCDLKPNNVLLNEGMTAYVSDFGIAKLLLGNSMTIASTSAMGTIGYMPPEFGSRGTISRMGDVYSFGILLLETFTGKRPTDTLFMDGELTLREWVSKEYTTSLLEIVDHSLVKDWPRVEKQSEDVEAGHRCLSSVIELGLLCSRSLPEQRIPMTHVVPRLKKIREEYASVVRPQ